MEQSGPSGYSTEPPTPTRDLGGPAVIIGHSRSGGAATIAAAQDPGSVIAPF
ncbi:hypothetical protein NRB20_52400 [Nocardia sp. RB20]|uniref:Uncharacterized protein n=1 Tax=Nocardia macrotermitis TaxID=2585198 RepID=A0A7K0D8S2_9NOCA|nr:hypothetical protein [Nocardia macrotermitis]